MMRDVTCVLVAKPLDLDQFMQSGLLTGWEGNVFLFESPGDAGLDGFGSELVGSYWGFDADIGEWWRSWVDEAPNLTHVRERFPVVTRWDWVYVGAPVGLMVVANDPHMRIGCMKWCDRVELLGLQSVDS